MKIKLDLESIILILAATFTAYRGFMSIGKDLLDTIIFFLSALLFGYFLLKKFTKE